MNRITLRRKGPLRLWWSRCSSCGTSWVSSSWEHGMQSIEKHLSVWHR